MWRWQSLFFRQYAVKLLTPSHSRLNHFAIYWQKRVLPCKAEVKITPNIIEDLAKVSTLLSSIFAQFGAILAISSPNI